MRLVYLALGWAAGIVLVETGQSRSPGLWGLLILAALGALWLNRATRWRWGHIALVAFTLGGLRASFLADTSPVAAFNNRGGLTVTGVVTDEPDRRDTGTLLRMRVVELEQGGVVRPMRGNVLVRAPRITPANYGDTIRATGQLEIPGVFDNFSYTDYLARQGVFSIMSNAAVEVTATGGGNPLYRALLTLKANTAATINRAIPEPEAGLLVGILLGNERGLSPELQADFAATGTAHIIAISGFNMVILAGVVTAFLEQTPLRGLRAGIIAITVIAIYTVFVGAGAAVVRAAIMSGVLVIGGALRRRTYVPASLAFVAVIMSAFSPRVLWSVSFQLSFFATLGLALFADPFARYFEAGLVRLLPRALATTLGRLLSEPLIVSVAALITTLPLTTLYFNRLSLVQLPVNLLVVPVQAFVLLSGILATLIAPLSGTVAQAIYWFDMALLNWTVWHVRQFASLPFAEIEFYVGARPVQLFFVMIIGGAILQAAQPTWALNTARFARSRPVLGTVSLIGVVMLWLGSAAYTARPDGQLHVHMLDVGHSNGFLIETPGGAQILVDGGRFPSRLLTDIGDRLPFNDRHFEVVVVTQPDPLVYGALPAVLARYDAGVVLTNGQPNASNDYAQLQDALAPFEVVEVTAGYRVVFDDGTQLEVLAPYSKPGITDSLDDNTLVLRLSYGDVAFLLTSDLSAAGQSALLENGGYPLATVLQLPQHASARALDEAFLDQTQAQVYLLHNDRANRRGDPNPDTLALLDASVPLYRTDAGGTVHLWTDGARLWLGPR